MWATWNRWRANRAFRKGDLTRSAQLLAAAGRFNPGCDRRLSRKLTRALVRRAETQTGAGNISAAWADLWMATEVALDSDQDWLSRHKHRLVELTIETADSLLLSGKINQALQLVREIEKRRILDWRADRIAQTARLIQNADEAASKGQVRLSNQQLAMARNLRPDLDILNAKQRACEHRRTQLESLSRQLEGALLAEDWAAVDRYCSEILLVAPNYQIAIDARRRMEEKRRSNMAGAVPKSVPTIESASAPDANGGERFMLWIDSVGGFLVCPGPYADVGCAVPQTHVDIPVMADLKRVHARFERLSDGFRIAPLSREGIVLVNGKRVDEPEPLLNGQTIQFDGGVQWTFQQPHPLSVSARLSFQSRHRTQPWSDGILLVADTIMIGKNPKSHVWCPDWPGDLMIFRRDERWFCRFRGHFQVDGRTVRDEAEFRLNSRIAGPGFSIGIEQLQGRST